MQSFFSLGDVSKDLKVPTWKILYAISTGRVPDVRIRCAGKRVFQKDDVSRLATHFGIDTQTPSPSKATEHISENYDQTQNPNHP
ncbi:MAG: hypothetical protein EBS53_15710 [Bacteroidetes bacterium]|nr:hypothetical protein [Bacteroidota bacterium]